MTPATIYLSLGSNLGDRIANLSLALQALAPEIEVQQQSSVYETPPWGYQDQPPFLNLAVKATTKLPPPALLARLKEIETAQGRKPTFRYGPRLIDLDILLYNDLVLDTPMLTIPHRHMAERSFVLIPMTDIAPHLVHPTLGRTITELLVRLDHKGIHKYKTRLTNPK